MGSQTFTWISLFFLVFFVEIMFRLSKVLKLSGKASLSRRGEPEIKSRFRSLPPFRPGFDSSIRFTILIIFVGILSQEKLLYFPKKPDSAHSSGLDLEWEIQLFLIVIATPVVFWGFITDFFINWKLSLSRLKRNFKSFLAIVGRIVCIIPLVVLFTWFVFWIYEHWAWFSWIFVAFSGVATIITAFRWLPIFVPYKWGHILVYELRHGMVSLISETLRGKDGETLENRV